MTARPIVKKAEQRDVNIRSFVPKPFAICHGLLLV